MRCHYCKDNPAAYLTLHHNVGMVLMRRTYTSHARMCRDCARRAYWHHQVRNVTLGWWGFISFCATWLYLIGNTARYVAAVRSIAREEHERNAPGDGMSPEAAARLAPFEVNVAWRLRDGECADDIARDLAEATGVTDACALQFIEQRAHDRHDRAS